MSGSAPQRGLFGVIILAAVLLVCLLLGHRWLEGYIEEQRAKHPPPAPDASSGVTGRVTFADGAPAAGVRVDIEWRDSAGRPGTTPAVTDMAGAFSQSKVPLHSEVTGMRAVVGPLVAPADAAGFQRAGASGVRCTLTLPAEFRLAGLLRRMGDRAPIAGATLDVAGVRATSGAIGNFKIEHIAASVLRDERPVVHIAAEGYKPLDWPLPKDAEPQTYGDLTILMEPVK